MLIEQFKVFLWKLTKRYKKELYLEYFPSQCEDCGWSGLSIDCDGGGQIADTGDYSEITCPICHGSIYDIHEFNFKDRIKFTFRKITFWAFRKKKHEEKKLNEYLKLHGML